MEVLGDDVYGTLKLKVVFTGCSGSKLNKVDECTPAQQQ
jgi:hypothetical protein